VEGDTGESETHQLKLLKDKEHAETECKEARRRLRRVRLVRVVVKNGSMA